MLWWAQRSGTVWKVVFFFGCLQFFWCFVWMTLMFSVLLLSPPTSHPPLLPPWIPLGHELRASFWNFLLVLGGLWKSKTGGQYLKDMSFLIICLLRDLGGWGQWVLGQMFSKPNFAACFSHYWRSVCALLTWRVACAWVLVWQRNSVWWHYIQIFTLTFDLFHYFH